MNFDYSGYDLKFIQCDKCKDGSKHLYTKIYKCYSSKTHYFYIVRAEYHELDVYAIKFYVIGYNPMWIDEKYNPKGVRMCFMAENGFLHSAKWDNERGEYIIDISEFPTHYMFIPEYPQNIDIFIVEI